MPKPKVFIGHRWQYNEEYHKLVNSLGAHGFPIVNYSVPEHDPFDWAGIRRTKAQLAEQIRQCNYFIVFGRMASNSDWCQHEVGTAVGYEKPILAVYPRGYRGSILRFMLDAEKQGGPISFYTPAIISQIFSALSWDPNRSDEVISADLHE